MAKIAVTGCAGFVGSWVCEKALAAGYEVIGIDNLTSNVNYTQKEVEFHHIDVNNNIIHILKDVEAIVHTAAYAELRHNWENKSERDRIFLNNEVATKSVLEQMPDVPIIFMSTGAIYGSLSHIKNLILTEENASPEYVESPYAASKLACEAYIAAWSHKRKTPWYALRLVNQVGARTHRGVITDFLRKVRQDNHIHAADNGKQRKNWVSVEDTADIVVRLLDRKNEVPSGIYTVTSEERWSWCDIVGVMRKMYGEKYNMEASFNVTCEDCIGGSVGDPLDLYVSGNKLKPYYECKRSVEQAIRDALTYLKWV